MLNVTESISENNKDVVDEYAENDTSDEEDIRNTTGNIPMNWYDEYKHLGEGYVFLIPFFGKFFNMLYF